MVDVRVFSDEDGAAAAPLHPWTETKPHPWRRYFARSLDNLLIGGMSWVVLAIVLALVAPQASPVLFGLLDGPAGRVVDFFLTILDAIPGNAVSVGLTGGTPGKWLFGIRVARHGRPIGVRAELARELMVWWRGLGCGVPLISFITMIIAYNKLEKLRETTWDAQQGNLVTYRPASTGAWALMIGGVVLLTVLGLALQLLGKLPA
jgi:uncharacterized RDD family membrane protein YckC